MPIQISPQGLQLQQQAMGMPRDQMQALLNQQIGLIPLPELLAIKNAVDRAQIRNAPPQAQPEQTTVAQDLMVQKGMQDRMQGGVAALPVANVGNEAAYARGGIVAFQNRGLVEAQTSPFERSDLGQSMFVQPDQAERMEENRKRQILLNQIRTEYGPKAGMFGYFMKQSDEDREAAKNIIERAPTMSVEEMQAILSSGPKAPHPKIGGGHTGVEKGLGRLTSQIPTRADALAAASEQDEKTNLQSPPRSNLKYMSALTEEEFGLTKGAKDEAGRSITDRIADIQKARGEDVLSKQETRAKGELEKRTGKAAETKDMWLALSQGFFEMAASGKPTFGGALAAGAERGFEAYRQAIAKRDDLKERYQEKLDAIARAKQAQAEGDYRYAASERRADMKELTDLQKGYSAAKRDIDKFNAGVSNDQAMQAERIAAQANLAKEEAKLRDPDIAQLERRITEESLKPNPDRALIMQLTALVNSKLERNPDVMAAKLRNALGNTWPRLPGGAVDHPADIQQILSAYGAK